MTIRTMIHHGTSDEIGLEHMDTVQDHIGVHEQDLLTPRRACPQKTEVLEGHSKSRAASAISPNTPKLL